MRRRERIVRNLIKRRRHIYTMSHYNALLAAWAAGEQFNYVYGARKDRHA